MSERNSTKPYNRFDLVFQLQWLIVKQLFYKNRNSVEKSEEEFLTGNANIHRWVVWVNLILVTIIQLSTKDLNMLSNNIHLLVFTAVIVLISGMSWFTFSMSGIPIKFIKAGEIFRITLLICLTISSTLLISITVTNLSVLYTLVIVGIYICFIQIVFMFDHLDGLKIGLDQSLFKYSKAIFDYHNIDISEFTDQKVE